MRFRLCLFVVAVAAAAAPANANAALAFLFDQVSAAPNDLIVARAGGTPRAFRPQKPLSRPVRLYLLRNELVDAVHSRFDGRLAFIGSVRLDRRGRGAVTFSVPPLDAGEYAIAYWCPGCAPYSRGRTFFVQDVREFVEPYRSQAVLRIATTQTCPVTRSNGSSPPRVHGWNFHGNGLLFASFGNGLFTAGPDGISGQKLIWAAAPAVSGALMVTYRRLDAAEPPQHAIVVAGTLYINFARRISYRGPSWASRMSFTPGCWGVTGRIRDVSLTFVVQVVPRG